MCILCLFNYSTKNYLISSSYFPKYFMTLQMIFKSQIKPGMLFIEEAESPNVFKFEKISKNVKRGPKWEKLNNLGFL